MRDDVAMIPYIVYESAEAKAERTAKRLIIALIIAVVLFFASNALWLHAWMQYDYSDIGTEEMVTVDAGNGTANYIGQDGDITNGYDNSKEENTDTEQNKKR